MRYVFCLLLILLIAHLEGMELEPIREFTPVLKLPPGTQPAVIQSARYDVTVRGLFAETSATYVFSNPNPRPQPGELEFPLPDGAIVCGYALDVDGQLVDGVVVGKDQARMILETESRVRRDPGLVEQVRGNLFRTRIFPLPAMGTRTVRITWTAELERNGRSAAARILMPRVRLPALDIHLDIAAVGGEPELSGLGNLHLSAMQDRRVADCHLTDIQPSDDLSVDLPILPPQLCMVEEHAGETFVAISRVQERGSTPLPAPARLAVAWDAGLSRSADGIARAQAVLLALMQRWPQTVFDVVAIRDVPGPAAPCRTDGELTAHLAQLQYDGGTSLAALDLTRAHLPNAQDAGWILVSDGISMIGDGLPFCGDVPVTVLSCESIQDAAVLGLIARATGGQVVDARAMPADAAASLIANATPQLLRVDALPGVVEDVQIVHRSNCDLLLARLTRDGELRLMSGCNGIATHTDLVSLSKAAAIPGTVIARAWAGAQAGVLAIDPLANHDRLLSLGRSYGVVTAGTSLLVLERLDQYVHYQVEPPVSRPEMRQQYLQAMKQRQDATIACRMSYRAALAQRWRERVEWWEFSNDHAAPAQPAQGGGQMHEVPAIGPAPGAGAVQPARIATSRPSEVEQMHPVDAPEAGLSENVSIPASAPATGQARDALVEDAEEGGHGSFAAIGAGGTSASMERGFAIVSAMGGSAYGPDAIGSISITPFQPDAPYLRELTAADQSNAYSTYLRLRDGRRSSPSFYLDCANVFLRRDQRLGHRILSNLLALRIEDPGLLRIVAWRLSEAGELDRAIAILRHVLLLRPEEPQSYRDLASALAQRAESSHRAQDLEEGMGLLMRVVTFTPMMPAGQAETALWNCWTRCPDLDLIALEELNHLIARAQRGGLDRRCVIPDLDADLRKNLDCDMRVVMGWDQDETDIDLHVIEPCGEEAFYGHRETASGGLVSHDNTIGYGPEEYVLRHAPSGTYHVACQYFASHTLTLFGPATVTATVFLDWGRPAERRQMLTLRLDRPGEGVPVGAVEMTVPGSSASPGDGSVANACVTREQIVALTHGAKRAAVEASFGAPLRVDQDGVTILLYRLSSGDVVRLGFGPDLIWAREVQMGAERDLLR